MMTSPPTPVYAKTNPAGVSLSPRRKRILLVICAVLVAATAAGSIWAALTPDSLASSARGCISVNIAGSIGGELIHECGSDAKSACRSAYAHSDPVSLALRPACEQAGWTPAKVAAG
jgi:hypothetical protein